eukprot:1008301-Pelagomonas_calceolata.AAC.9
MVTQLMITDEGLLLWILRSNPFKGVASVGVFQKLYLKSTWASRNKVCECNSGLAIEVLHFGLNNPGCNWAWTVQGDPKRVPLEKRPPGLKSVSKVLAKTFGFKIYEWFMNCTEIASAGEGSKPVWHDHLTQLTSHGSCPSAMMSLTNYFYKFLRHQMLAMGGIRDLVWA